MKEKLSIEPNAKNISDLCKTFQEKFNKSLTPSSNCELKTVPFQSLSLGLPLRPLRTKIAKSASSPIKEDQKKNTTVFQLKLAVLSKPTSVDEKPTILQRNSSASKEPRASAAKTKEAAKKFLFLESALIAFRFVPSRRNTFALPYKLPLQVKKRSTRQIASHKDRSFDSNLEKKAGGGLLRAKQLRGWRSLFISFCFSKEKKKPSPKNVELPFFGKKGSAARRASSPFALIFSAAHSAAKNRVTPPPKGEETSSLPVGGLPKQLRGLKKRFSFYPKQKKERFLKPLVFLASLKKRKGLKKNFFPFDFKLLKQDNFLRPSLEGSCVAKNKPSRGPATTDFQLKLAGFRRASFVENPSTFQRSSLGESRRASVEKSNEPAFFLSIAKKKETALASHPLQQGSNLEHDIRKPYRRTPPFFSYWLLPFVGLLTLIPDSKLPTLPTDLKLDTMLFNVKNEAVKKKENSVFPKKIAPFVFSDNAPEGHPSREAALKNRVFLTRRRSYGEAATPCFAPPIKKRVFLTNSFWQQKLAVLSEPTSFAAKVKSTVLGFQRSLSAPKEPQASAENPYGAKLCRLAKKTSDVAAALPQPVAVFKTQINTKRPSSVNKLEFPSLSYTKAYLLLENIMKKQINGLSISNRQAVARRGPLCTKGATSFFFTDFQLKLAGSNFKNAERASFVENPSTFQRSSLGESRRASVEKSKKAPPILFSHLRLKSRAFQPFLPEGRKERSYLSKNAQRHPQGVFRTFFEPMLTALPPLKKKHTGGRAKQLHGGSPPGVAPGVASHDPLAFVESKGSDTNLRFSTVFQLKLAVLSSPTSFAEKPSILQRSSSAPKEPRASRTAAKSKSPYFFWRRLQKLNASIKKPKKPISFLISETELLNAVSQRKPRANRTPSATVLQRASAAKTKEKGLQKKNALLLNTSFKEEHFLSSNNSLSLRGAAKQGLLASKPKGEEAGGGKGHQSLVGFQLPFSLKKEKDRIYLQSLLNQLALFRDLISDSTPPVFESLLRSPNSIKNPLSKKDSLRRGTASFGPFILQSKKRSRAVFSKKEFVLASHSAIFQQKLAVLSKPTSFAEKSSMLQRSSSAPKEPRASAATTKGAKKRLLAFFLRKQERAFDKGYKSPLDEFGKTKADITGHYKLIQGVQSLKNSLDQIFVSSSLKNSKKKGGPLQGAAGGAGSSPPEGKNYLASQAKGLLKIGAKQNMKDNKKIIEDSYTAWLQNEFAFLDNAVRNEFTFSSVRSKPPIEKLKGRDYAHKGGTLYKNRCPSLFHGHKKTTSRIIKMQHPILISGYTFAALKKFSASKPKLREENFCNPPLPTRGRGPTKVLKSRAFKPLLALLPSLLRNSKQGAFIKKDMTRACDFQTSKGKASLISNLFAHSFLNLNNSLHPSAVKEGGFETSAVKKREFLKKAAPLLEPFVGGLWSAPCSALLLTVQPKTPTSDDPSRGVFKNTAHFFTDFQLKLAGSNLKNAERASFVENPSTFQRSSLVRRFLNLSRRASVEKSKAAESKRRQWESTGFQLKLAVLSEPTSFAENPSILQRSSSALKEPRASAAKSKRTLNLIHANKEAIKMASIKKVSGALFAARDSNQEWTPFKSIKERGTNHLGRTDFQLKLAGFRRASFVENPSTFQRSSLGESRRASVEKSKVIRIRKGEIKIRIDKLFRCFLFPAPFGQHILPTKATRVIKDSKPSRGLFLINHFLPLPLFLTSASKQVGQNQKLLQKPKSFERGYVKKKRAFFGALASFGEHSLLSKHKQGVQSKLRSSPLTKDFVFIEKQNKKDLVRKGEEGLLRWPHKTPRTESFTFLSRKSEPKEHGIHNKKENNLLFKNRFDFSKADVNSLFLWEKKQGVLQSNSGGPKNALLFRGEGAALLPQGGLAQQAPLVVAVSPQPRNSKLKRERLLKPLHFFRRSSSFVSKAGSLSYRPYGASLQNRKGAAIGPQSEKIFLKSHSFLQQKLAVLSKPTSFAAKSTAFQRSSSAKKEPRASAEKPYNITKNAIKNSKKKRRALKQKRETGRLLKRKRFHPRPAWLRVTMHKKLLKYRHIKNDDLACPVGVLASHSKARGKHLFFAAQATTAEKEFYSISQSVFAAFQQGLWKSSWLRSNLNSYLRKIKTSFNLIKQTSQNSELGFSTKKIISDCLGLTKAPSFLQQKYIFLYTVLSKPTSFAAKSTVFQRSSSASKEPRASAEKPYAESELRFDGATPRNGFARHPFALLASRPKGAKATGYEKAVSKWNTVLQIAEYNQITYHRIQQIITNMKHSLGREGAKRTSADSLSKVSLNKSPFIGTPALPRKEERSFMGAKQAPNTSINNIATKSGPVDPKKNRPFNNAHHKLKRQSTEGSVSKPSKKAEPFLEPSTFSFNLFNFVNTVIQTPGSLKSRIHQQLKEQPFFTIQTFGNMSQKRVYWALNKTHMWHFKNSNKKEYLWANQKQREQNRSNKTKKILNKFLTLPLQEQYPGTTVVNKNQNKKNQKGAEVGGACFAQQDPLVSPLELLCEASTTPPLTLFPTSLGLSLLEAEPVYKYKSVRPSDIAEKPKPSILLLQRPYASAAKTNVEKWKEQNQKSLNTFFKKQEQKEIKMGDLGFLDSNGPHSNLLFMKDLFANSFKESYNPNCISFFDEATGTTKQGSLLLTRKAEEHSKKHPSEAARAFFEGEKVPVFIKEHKMFLRNLKNTLRVSSPSFLQRSSSGSASKEPYIKIYTSAEKSLEKATNSAPLKIIKLSLSAPKEPRVSAAKRKGALLSSLIWSSPKSYSQMGADARPWGGVEVGAKSINYVRHNFLTVPFLRDFSFLPFTCQKPLLAARTKQGPLLKRHTLMKKGANTRFMRLAMGGNYSTPVNLKIPRPFLRQAKPHEAKQKQKQKPLSSEISTSMKPENFVGTLNKPLFLRQQKGQHRGQLFLSQSAFLLCTIIFHLCSLFSLVSLSQIRCVIKFILLLAIKLSSFVKILRFAKPFKHRTLLMAPKIRLRKVPKSSPFFSRSSLKNPLLLLPKASLTVGGLISHAQQALPEVAPTLLKQNLSALKEPYIKIYTSAEIPNAKQIGAAWVRTRRKPLRHPLELLRTTPWHKKGDPAEGSTFDVNQEQKKGGLKKGRAFFRQGAKKMPLAFFLTKQRSFWVGPLSCFTRSSFFDKKNEKRATKLNTFLKIGSKKLGFVLHTGLSKVTDIRNTGTKSASVFLGKPGESLSVWINHLFLIEIAADSTTTIPENSDSSLWNSYAKLAKSSSTTPILGTLLEKRLLSSFEFFLERVSQPDTDLIVRQRKGTIFLDNLLFRTSGGSSACEATPGPPPELLRTQKTPRLKNVSESAGNQRSSLREVLPSFLALLKMVTLPEGSSPFYPHSTSKMGCPSDRGDEKAGRSLLFSRRVTDSTIGKSMIFDWTAKRGGGEACPSDGRAASPAAPPLKELQNTGNSKVLLLDTRVRKRWSANQFSTFKGKDSDLLIHAPPAPKSFHSLSTFQLKLAGFRRASFVEKSTDFQRSSLGESRRASVENPYPSPFLLRSSTSQKNTNKKIGGLLLAGGSKTKLLQHHYNFNAEGIAPLGTIVCQIYSGLFSKETAKSCLVVGIASSNYDEKSLLIQSLAGETEMKIIRDNANRYNFALGIKSLRNVFDALALHTPCIFLIEDIHVIGERRPLLVGDDENARADSSGESHDEKNLSVAKLTRHSIMHYKKPFRGDFSSLIPANNFSFDLFLENDFINKAQTLVAPKTTLKTTKNSLDELPWMGGLVLFQKSTYPLVVAASPQPTKAPPSLLREPKKASNDLAYYAARRKQPFLPSLYEQKGRTRSRSGCPEDGPPTIFSKEPEVQKGLLKIKNSIRIKIALLANSAVSNLSVKLNMITDLLVIIDGVRSNRGFVVFATTHIPSSLDPALRRPGRLDETIVLPFLPKLESRWEIVKAHFARSTQDAARSEATASSDSFLYKSGGPLTPSLSFNLDFRFLTHPLNGRGSPLSKNAQKAYLEVPFERLSKFTAFQQKLAGSPTSFAEKPSILQRSLSAKKEPYIKIYTSAAKTKPKHEKSKTQSKSEQHAVSLTLSAEYSSSNLLNLVATAYSKIGKLLINNKFANCAETNLSLFSTLHSQLKNQQNQIQTLEPYLHLYTTQSIVKLFLMGLFAPKVAETFAFSGLIKKRRPSGTDCLEKITGPLLLATQDPASSLIFSLIEKKLIYKKNVIIPRLLQFSNAALLSPQEPSGEATFVLLPARRYGSYKQTFLAMQKLPPPGGDPRNPSLPSDADSKVSNVESGLSDSDLGLIVEKKSLVTRGEFFDRPTLINGYYRNKVLNRHRGYLTNQWWNGHLYEHNVETTFLGDIDWRSNCFASKKGRPLKFVQAEKTTGGRAKQLQGVATPTKTWENFYVDFPDSDSHYNSNNRRWVLHFGYWSYWSNYKTAHNREIYSFMVTESFLETFNYLNSNREILDFFVTRIIKSGSLKDINVVEGLKRF